MPYECRQDRANLYVAIPSAMKSSLFILATLLWVCASALSTEQFLFQRVGLEQGLPQADVQAITQSTDGFIWIATQDGLCRFDGMRIDVLRQSQQLQTRIQTNSIRNLIRLDSGNLALTSGGLWFIYRKRYHDFVPGSRPVGYKEYDPADPGYPSDVLYELTDSRGRRWRGTRTQGALRVDPKTGRTTQYARDQPSGYQLAVNEVWSIEEDSRGRIWIGTNGGGVAIVDGETISTTLVFDADNRYSIPSNIIRTIYRDGSGVMWVGTYGGGLSFWDPSRSKIQLYRWSHHTDPRENDYVRCFAVDSKGSLYVGTRTGIVRYDKRRRSREFVASWATANRSYGAVQALYVDRYDNLWIGTERNGLGILEASHGSIRWLRGPDWMINGRPIRVASFTELGRDTLAIGSIAKIAMVDIRERRPVWYKGPFVNGDSTTTQPISSIYRIEETGELVISSDIGLFRGTFRSGFQFVRCADTSATYPNVNILRLAQRMGDTLYVGTWGGGIRKFHLPSWRETVFDTRHGLPNNTVYAVIPRKDGSFLASSNAGILYITPQWKVIVYGVEQGAQASEFNTGAWRVLSDGTILLGGVNGFNALPADFTPQLRAAPSMYLHDVRIDGVQLKLANQGIGQHIQMNPGQKSLSISFGSIATSRPSTISYRYRLLPGDSTWTYTTLPFLMFNQITTGEQQLEIESSFAVGSWGARLTIPIVVMPHFWEKWWFILLVGSSITAGVVGGTTLVNRRSAQRAVEREQLLNQERERIARDLHDDVGAGLTRIVIVADELASRGSVPGADISRISDMARTAIESVRSIVWVIKTTDTSLRNTVKFIRDKADDVLADRGIRLEFRAPEVLPVSPLSILARRNVILASQEIIANIIRHSKATAVTMAVTVERKNVLITFIDNGIGYSKVGSDHSNGIENMRVRMREVDGRFEIQRLSEGGTQITLTVPLKS